jgi:hypothetical protein
VPPTAQSSFRITPTEILHGGIFPDCRSNHVPFWNKNDFAFLIWNYFQSPLMADAWCDCTIGARTCPQASGGRSAAKPARVFGRVGAHTGGSATRERHQNFLTAFWCRADKPANNFAPLMMRKSRVHLYRRCNFFRMELIEAKTIFRF